MEYYSGSPFNYAQTYKTKNGYIVKYTKVVYIIFVVYVKFNIMCLIYSGIPVKC